MDWSCSGFFYGCWNKKLLKILAPLIAFVIVLSLTALAGHNVAPLKWYIVCVILQMIVAYISDDKPAKTLLYFSIMGVIAMIVGVMSSGTVAIYAFLCGGLACSIMWPSIFHCPSQVLENILRKDQHFSL